MKKTVLIPLLLILFVAFFLRFYKVTEIPPSLNWDEVSIGYNAYSIMKTGKDEWNEFLPIHFKSYGEFKLPVQVYASIPGVYMFGLTELGVRITPVVYGTLTVLLIFFLARSLFKNETIGLLSALFLAISPWHIHLTRASFESSFATFWLTIGVWLLIKGFEYKRWWIWSVIPLAISMYTYNSARLFVPLFIFILFLIYFKDIINFKKIIVISAGLFLILLIPIITFTLSGEGAARYKLVSITNDPGLIPRINENRGNTDLPVPIPRLIHNKVTYVSYYFIKNYLMHLSPQFLFISGAPHKQHHVQGLGQLYMFQIPFLIVGLYFLFKNKIKFKWILLGWILVAYIPVSTTVDSIPHALRTLIAAPAYQIILAFGAYELFVLFKNKKLRLLSITAIAVLALFNFKTYLEQNFVEYSKSYSQAWQYGYKEVVSYVKENQEQYDVIVFSRYYGEPHMFYLFFSGYDPAKFQNDPKLDRFETGEVYNWVRVLKFDKFYFPDLSEDPTPFSKVSEELKDKRVLYIGRENDFPKELPRLKKIYFLDGKSAFDIIEKI